MARRLEADDRARTLGAPVPDVPLVTWKRPRRNLYGGGYLEILDRRPPTRAQYDRVLPEYVARHGGPPASTPDGQSHEVSPVGREQT